MKVNEVLKSQLLHRKPMKARFKIIEYGNVLSPIIDLISYRYEHQLPTIITSNLTPQQISEVYGKRIGDRLKETTEIVPFLNGSYRG